MKPYIGTTNTKKLTKNEGEIGDGKSEGTEKSEGGKVLENDEKEKQ